MSIKMKSINAVVEITNSGEKARDQKIICNLPEDNLLEYIKNNELNDFILEAADDLQLNHDERLGSVVGYTISDYKSTSDF